MQRSDISALEERIGYSFKNKNILKEALTHSSYANELKARKQAAVCNERLEFLGDSVLSIVVSRYLFTTYPREGEGILTNMRKDVVCADALAPVQEKFKCYMSDKAQLEAQMKKGAEEASYYARRTLSKVQKKLGFVQLH